LSGIREQLEQKGVKKIQAILEVTNSTYLPPFLKLSDLIQKGSEEAQDNLKFLTGLQEPCQDLASAAPKEIIEILPRYAFNAAHTSAIPLLFLEY
jgi:dynein heavy chain